MIALPPAALAALEAALPAGRLSTDADLLAAHRHDEATMVEAGHPALLVRPRSTAEVQAVLRIASAHRLPVVPRGAGTGLAGGANAVDGCIVLSLAAMDRILELDARSLLAVVQPGVVNGDLRREARAAGLSYPPDPASFERCTLGGNIATNAGGLCCVKYGVTRESVLALEAVLADGTVLRTGTRTVKSVAGYDLTRLLVGSEGTLAVVTEATLRLRPRPQGEATLVAFFPSLPAAGAAVSAIVETLTPSLLEIMDRATVGAVESWQPLGLDTAAAAMLLARSDAGGEAEAEAARMAAICRRHGAGLVVEGTGEEEGAMLLTARRLAHDAIHRLGDTYLDDVAVPIGRIADMLAAIEEIAAEHGVFIGTFGHAGDGNLHPTIVFDRHYEDSLRRARTAFEALLAAALERGGTQSGEHGIGLLKRPYLERQLDAHHLRLQRAIKAAFDPQGILNPGKLF